MGDPPERLIKSTPSEGAIKTVTEVMRIQSHYWRSMTPRPIAKHDGLVLTDRLHGKTDSFNVASSIRLTTLQDSIRELQAKQLYESCKLTELWIYRTAISKSFNHQVLAR